MDRPHVIDRYMTSLGGLEAQGLELSDLEKDFLKVLRYVKQIEEAGLPTTDVKMSEVIREIYDPKAPTSVPKRRRRIR